MMKRDILIKTGMVYRGNMDVLVLTQDSPGARDNLLRYIPGAY